MAGCPDQFYAAGKRLMVGFGSDERRKKRVVDIDNAARVSFDKFIRQNLHVARKDDEICLVALKLSGYCGQWPNFDRGRLVEVALANGLQDKLVRWGDERQLTNGQLRMLIGTQLRTLLKQGYDVTIGPETLEGKKPERLTYAELKALAPKPARTIRELLEDLGYQA